VDKIMTTKSHLSVMVQAGARLHLGFVDLHGGLGRLYGSIGVALRQPRVVLEAQRSSQGIRVEGEPVERTRLLVQTFATHFGYHGGFRLVLRESIPEHVGLGAGTQISLAVGAAVATLLNQPVNVRELARVCERGTVSGIGTAIFEQGGLVIDGGVLRTMTAPTCKSAVGSVPPVIVRHSVPKDWVFVVALPTQPKGLSGAEERHAFGALPPVSPEHAGVISRLVLMQLLPALVENDIVHFGEALTEIQRLVGDAFASAQGGRFGTKLVTECIEAMLDAGAYGAGQSSWGPACYGLTRGVDGVKSLQGAVKRVFDGTPGGVVFASSVSNRGATIRQRSSRAL
jgi:beta-ribofuranosylaminobenzene 5'-phosphate synthase